MEQITQENKPVNNIWVIVILIIITALIVGGGVFAWMSYTTKKQDKNLKNELTALNNKLTQCTKSQNESAVQTEKESEPKTVIDENNKKIEIENNNEPEWLTYSDQDISFKYPKTFCGTSWQDFQDTNCDKEWTAGRKQFERTITPEDKISGNTPQVDVAYISPSYSTYGYEFLGSYKIYFISKSDYDNAGDTRGRETFPTNNGYYYFIVKEDELRDINAYYLSGNGKYLKIVQEANFNYYPEYFYFLLDSIELK